MYGGETVTGEMALPITLFAPEPGSLQPPPTLGLYNKMDAITHPRPQDIFHDETAVQRVISSLVPSIASKTGGQPLTIRGLGFDAKTATVTIDG